MTDEETGATIEALRLGTQTAALLARTFEALADALEHASSLGVADTTHIAEMLRSLDPALILARPPAESQHLLQRLSKQARALAVALAALNAA